MSISWPRSVLSKQIDDLEPTLTRHGYTTRVLAELLGAKPGEVRALFRQSLGAERSRELKLAILGKPEPDAAGTIAIPDRPGLDLSADRLAPWVVERWSVAQ